tara:strand:+ start:216 stop:449 length:234 start_codon:yes stop_codon:yes gene_type:complete
MKVTVLKERMLDAIDKLTMVRSYRVINPERKSDNYWFIYAKIPGFFVFKGKTKDFANRIEIGPCINWTKYLLVIEWY